jgi:glycosyltransferase involved in cell wall biosynthesis
LLPGCNPADLPDPRGPAAAAGPLELFYVGGVVPPLYDLKPMLDALRPLQGVHLTLCCRPAEWARVRGHYEPLDPAQVTVVHAYGAGLAPYYAAADVLALFWRHRYLEITMPVKIIEALGYGLPVIAAAGTVPAAFVQAQGVGWSVASAEEFTSLLATLRDRRELLAERRERARGLRGQHTWQARARQIAATLAPETA